MAKLLIEIEGVDESFIPTNMDMYIVSQAMWSLSEGISTYDKFIATLMDDQGEIIRESE